jgi:hypothetical protein
VANLPTVLFNQCGQPVTAPRGSQSRRDHTVLDISLLVLQDELEIVCQHLLDFWKVDCLLSGSQRFGKPQALPCETFAIVMILSCLDVIDPFEVARSSAKCICFRGSTNLVIATAQDACRPNFFSGYNFAVSGRRRRLFWAYFSLHGDALFFKD